METESKQPVENEVQENVQSEKTRGFIWKHAITGLSWGIYIGIALKFLDTFIGLVQIDVLTSILFLVAIGVCFIPKIGIIATIIISFFLAQFTGINLFITVLASGIVGALLGILPGMAIGGLIGMIRKNSAKPEVKDIPEPNNVAVKAFILPLIGGAVLIALYFFVFNPWLISFLSL